MNFCGIQHFRRTWGVVINDLAMSNIQCFDRIHILAVQGKIPDIQVFFHPFPTDSLRNNDSSPLDMPSQYNLCRTLSVSVSDFTQQTIMKNIPLPF